MKNLKKLFAAVLALTMVLAFTACQKKAEPSQKADPNSKYGGTVTVGVTSDIDSLDPHKMKSASTREIMFNVYEGLVKSNVSGELIPAVSESYTISEDSMQIEFVLRQGVKFSNGKEVTGADVVYSLNRMRGKLENQDPEVAAISAFSVIEDVIATEKDGKTIITVKLSAPNTELICYMTCSIVPENYTTADGAAPGVGPFKYESYTPLQEYVIVRNENYYNTEKPYLDKVVFKIMTDADAAFTQVLAGAIDIFPYLTTTQAESLPSSYRTEVGGMALVQALFVNANEKPFDDIRVRQALNYAIDRKYIIEMTGGGYGTAVCSGIFPGFAKYYDSSLETYYTKDIEKAKALLAEAGFPDGFSFTITVPSNYKFHINTAEVIAEQLKAVGITVKVETVEWASWYSDVYKGRKYEGTIIGLDSNLAPSDILRFYPSTASKNFMNYNNAEFDRIFSLAVKESDDATKTSYYKQLQKMLTEDAAAVYIQNPALLVAVNNRIDGYTFYPMFVQEMSTVYIK